MKALLVGAAFLLVPLGAFAQSGDLPPQDSGLNGGPGVRAGNITSTGATVPNPGASQSAGTTELDRGVQREDDKITNGICKGC